MIDTHCHLNDNRYNKDIGAVVSNAKEQGVEYIIIPATSPTDLDKTIKIAEMFDNVYCGLGVHPHDASKFNENVYDRILKLSKHKKVVAIGEFGLDYYRNLSPKEEQIYAFNRQLDIAIETDLPALLHCRDADSDFVKVLENYTGNGLRGVCHCYSSGLEVAKKLLDMGVYFSFTANITYPKVNMSEVIKLIPLDKIMLETDSPYMTPPPNRSERNVPQNVLKVAEKISIIKNISLKEVIRMTTENAKSFFKIPILAVLFLLLGTNLYSQNNDYDDYYEDEYEELPDPYFRKLGFGPLLGANTFVDRYSSGLESFSYEGLFSAGAVINYRFAENFIAQVAYNYSENRKLADRLPDSVKGWIDPNYHNAIEFSVIGMVIPRNMVNFYVSLGTTYFMNKISKNFGEDPVDAFKSKYYFEDNNFGLNTGVGIFVNFSLGNMGTLVFNAEWKLGFRLDKITLDYDPREVPLDNNGEINPRYKIPTDYSSMSSVPRGGIIWYFPFF